MEEFAYYMIRLHRRSPEAEAQTLAGMVERLATGEKCGFASGEELLRLIDEWPASPANMRGSALSDNPGRASAPPAGV